MDIEVATWVIAAIKREHKENPFKQMAQSWLVKDQVVVKDLLEFQTVEWEWVKEGLGEWVKEGLGEWAKEAKVKVELG